MQILYSPQVNPGKKIEYVFEGEKITATLDGVSDTFDFTDMPDGALNIRTIESILPYRVVLSAVKENGILSVVLLNFIETDATEQERFPEWIKV